MNPPTDSPPKPIPMLNNFGETAVQAKFRNALALHKKGQLAQARELYLQVLKERPKHIEAMQLMGMLSHQAGNPLHALEFITRAIEIDPNQASSYNNRGLLLQELKRLEDALIDLNKALMINPNYAEAYSNRGNVLHELNRLDEAISSYDQALLLKPDFFKAYLNRGNVFRILGRFHDALTDYDRALKIKPNLAEVHNTRGIVLTKLERFNEAIASYDQALKLKPDYDFLYGRLLFAKLEACDWSDLEKRCVELTNKVMNNEKVTSPIPLSRLTSSLSLQRRAAEIWVNHVCRGSPSLPPIPKRTRHEKIRVGYFSAHYHNHATAYLIAELIERHDRDRFELFGLSFGRMKEDQMRKRISAAFDTFVDVRNKSAIDIALLSRSLEIDIAVDLTGHQGGNRIGIFSCGAAPLQVNYLAYPGTTGAKFMDYIIADRIVIPQASQQYYTEKIVYMPNSYQVNDQKRAIAAKIFSREELGLPSEGFVFCCFNHNSKISPSTFQCWMRILKQVEGSVIWLLERTTTFTDNLRREAEKEGVSAERLVFGKHMPLEEHLARHGAADLFIDTLPYNAHTTASDALWAGLPVLTCTAEAFASRVAASLLMAIDLPELITTTQEQYEALAVKLATNPKRLQQIRDKLRKNRITMPLFNTQLYTKHLENAYSQMYERYQADLSPDQISVV